MHVVIGIIDFSFNDPCLDCVECSSTEYPKRRMRFGSLHVSELARSTCHSVIPTVDKP